MKLAGWINRNLKSIIAISFVIPILLVAFVSISHVTSFYELANPISWAIYLSVAIEIAALGALAGITANMGRFIYVPFGIVTFIQLLGNVFFSYSYIDEGSEMFRQWVEMVAPLFDLMGVDENDFIGHKRILSMLIGGLLPMISLTFAHMLVKFSEQKKLQDDETTPEKVDIEELSTKAGLMENKLEEEAYQPTDSDLERLQRELERIQNMKFPSETQENVDNVEESPNLDVQENIVAPINRLTYAPRDGRSFRINRF
jgi:hypothetical protein